jgi:hypothetical protein
MDQKTPILLLEGQHEELAKRKLEKAGKLDAYEKLAELDKTPTKKHLPKLVDFFLEKIDINTIKICYNQFLDSKLRSVDINKYKKWQEFETKTANGQSQIELKYLVSVCNLLQMNLIASKPLLEGRVSEVEIPQI